MSSDNSGARMVKSKRRVLHWAIAIAFFALLATGLIIYTPAFSALASGSWTRLIHRIGAVILVGTPLLYILINRDAARQWLKQIAVWRGKASSSANLHGWKRNHKLLLSIGFIIIVLTGAIQWFLKDLVPSSVFNVSLFIHDIAFFSSIIVLLYHVYYEFTWWNWKRKYCRRCSFAYCADACPLGAIYSNHDGAIERVLEKCNNCRLCMENCQRNHYYRKASPPKRDAQRIKAEPTGQQT